MARSGVLLVVGSNPPSQTSGERTLRRVEVARQILGFDEARLVNLFAMPSYRSSGLGELGGSPEGWLAARGALDHGIMVAEAVVLAYGTQIPSGPARPHFRDQVAWLEERIATQQLPTWWVGARLVTRRDGIGTRRDTTTAWTLLTRCASASSSVHCERQGPR